MVKLFVALALIGSAYGAPIKVLTVDGNSTKVIVSEMSPESYTQTLVLTSEALETQAVKGLAHYQDRPGWRLSKFSLGLGVTGTIGLGPFQLGKALKQRFIFSR